MHFTLEFPETGVARPSCHQDNQKRKIAGFAEVVAQATIACPERQRAWGEVRHSTLHGVVFAILCLICPIGRIGAVRPHRDPSHIRDCFIASIVAPMEGSTMYLLYGLLILAMIFFLVLPITDARTARMKLSVVSSLGALLAVSIMLPRLIH
jgi:hypothetical protein